MYVSFLWFLFQYLSIIWKIDIENTQHRTCFSFFLFSTKPHWRQSQFNVFCVGEYKHMHADDSTSTVTFIFFIMKCMFIRPAKFGTYCYCLSNLILTLLQRKVVFKGSCHIYLALQHKPSHCCCLVNTGILKFVTCTYL